MAEWAGGVVYMMIEYTNTMDDVIAFQKFHIENSNAIRSTFRSCGVRRRRARDQWLR